MDRRAAERGRARAAGAFTDRPLDGAAPHVIPSAGVETEPIAQELLVDGLVALALGDRARHQGHRAGAVEADLGRLEPPRRGALDRVGEANAAQFPMPACVCAGLLGAL